MFWTPSTQQQFHIQIAIRAGEAGVNIRHQMSLLVDTDIHVRNNIMIIIVLISSWGHLGDAEIYKFNCF